MPHGRPRRSKSRYRSIDKLTARRKPHGCVTWLEFAAGTFVPPEYFAETKDGRRYRVLHQDPASVRRVMKVEWGMVRAISRKLILREISATAGPLDERPYWAWRNAVRNYLPEDQCVMEAAELTQEWMFPFNGNLVWVSLDKWRHDYNQWCAQHGL